MLLNTFSKLSTFVEHVRLTSQSRRFAPYVTRVSHGHADFDFLVANSTAELWYAKDVPVRPADGRIVHQSLELDTIVNDFVGPGEVILEVGGHHGFATIPLASRAGSQGTVVVFEPQSDNARVIRDNLRLNGQKNVRVEEVAVGDTDGEIGLVARTNAFVEPNSKFSLRRLCNRFFYPRNTVRSTTLDTYCRANKLQPTLLKIDVEGFEVAVLRGAQRTFAANPKFILEIHPQQIASYGVEVAELLKLLPLSRYRTWLMTEAGDMEEVSDIAASQLEQRVHLFGKPRSH